MQLHYLWIHRFGFLNNAGINLSSRFIIERKDFDEFDEIKKPSLIIKFNPDYIENFFEKKNVTNVSAIIGKNGTGKSSILNYIKSNLPEGLEARVVDDLFVYSIVNNDVEEYYVIESNNYSVILKDETKLFNKYQYGNLPISDTLRFTGHLSDAEYIYYSYFIEYNSELLDWSGLHNISTTALLANERKRIIEENKDADVRHQLLSESSDLENLTLSEVARAIQFFNSPDASKLPFKKPEELFIIINLTDRLFFNKNNSVNIDVFELLSELDKRNNPVTIRDGIINNLLLGIFINYLVDERKYSMNNPYRHVVPVQEDDSIPVYIMRFFQSMDNITITLDGKEVGIPKLSALSKLVPEFLAFIDDLLNKEFLRPVQDNNPIIMKLLLDDKTEESFARLRDYYLRVKGISTFFDFRWRSLSNGEQSYLSFMSRFYHIKNHEHGKSRKKNLIILIDEGDAGYHPEWQRKFFNITLNYLSDLFAEYTVQLIFTANTPFLSSDLPKSNVLFIEQMEDKSVIFHNKNNNQAETFAANIHTLFSDSFYMDGILIGEFAKNRLDTIIKYLNNSSVTIPNESYKRTIDLIGEPILKKKLQDMWFEKFGLDEELQQLQRRIDEINQIKKKQELNKKSSNKSTRKKGGEND